MNFGRNFDIPGAVRDKGPDPKIKKTDAKFWEDRICRLSAYNDLVVKNLVEAFAIQAQQYNVERREAMFRVGDLVLRTGHPLSDAKKGFAAKLAHLSSGPYRMKQIISPSVYELQSGRQNNTSHVRYLKPYVPPVF